MQHPHARVCAKTPFVHRSENARFNPASPCRLASSASTPPSSFPAIPPSPSSCPPSYHPPASFPSPKRLRKEIVVAPSQVGKPLLHQVPQTPRPEPLHSPHPRPSQTLPEENVQMGQLLLPQAQTINAKLSTLNPNGINPKPQTLNSKSRTLHPALLGGTRVRVKGIGLRV